MYMSIPIALGIMWCLYCIYHYSRGNQRIDSAMTRRDAFYLVVTLTFILMIF